MPAMREPGKVDPGMLDPGLVDPDLNRVARTAGRGPAVLLGGLIVVVTALGLAGRFDRAPLDPSRASPSAPSSPSGPSLTAAGASAGTLLPRPITLAAEVSPWPTPSGPTVVSPARIIEPAPDRPVAGTGALHVRVTAVPTGLNAVEATVLGWAGPIIGARLPVTPGGFVDAWMRLEPERDAAQPLRLKITAPGSTATLGEVPFVLAPADPIVPSTPLVPGGVIGGSRVVVDGLLGPGIWWVEVSLVSVAGGSGVERTVPAFVDRTRSPALTEFAVPFELPGPLPAGPLQLEIAPLSSGGQPAGAALVWPLQLAGP